jgi:hypothetical protein
MESCPRRFPHRSAGCRPGSARRRGLPTSWSADLQPAFRAVASAKLVTNRRSAAVSFGCPAEPPRVETSHRNRPEPSWQVSEDRRWSGRASQPRSAHEPQNAFPDFQRLAHLEVHGRKARIRSGKSHFAPDRLKAGLQTPRASAQGRLESRLQPVPGTPANQNGNCWFGPVVRLRRIAPNWNSALRCMASHASVRDGGPPQPWKRKTGSQSPDFREFK